MLTDLTLPSLLAIIGTLAAIFGPIVGHLLRNKEYRQLDIVIDRGVSLVNQLARNLENFSIIIDDQPASEQVVWITGWIINSGNFDISDRMIESPLELQLPKDMTWLRGTIEHHSEHVQCSSKISQDEGLQFSWVMLRSGEYLRFEALLQCPVDKIEEDWTTNVVAEMLQPYSRIENVKIESAISLSQFGERYNPTIPRKSNLTSKSIITGIFSLLVAFLLMSAFFPYDLDNIFDDGYLPAQPILFKQINDVPSPARIFINRENKIKLKLEGGNRNIEHTYDEKDELVEDLHVHVSDVVANYESVETLRQVVLSVLAVILSWIVMYIWFPSMFLFDLKKRRTASALFSLQRKISNLSILEKPKSIDDKYISRRSFMIRDE